MPRCTAYAVQDDHRSGKEQATSAGSHHRAYGLVKHPPREDTAIEPRDRQFGGDGTRNLIPLVEFRRGNDLGENAGLQHDVQRWLDA